MTPEERQLLGGLFQRVASTAATPRDAEAEAFITDAIRAQPHAPYALAQTVLVQRQALEAAAKRLQDLEAQVQSQNAPQEETSFLGNIGKSLFGGGQSAPPPRNTYDESASVRQSASAPPPYAPASQPQSYPPQQAYGAPPSAGPWGGAPAGAGGGGFLQHALTTAAGVAGGMMVADSLRGLFGGHAGFGAGGFGTGGFGTGGGETVVNNYYDNPDPAGQHAEDVLQDQDQDQDDAQDAADDSGGFSGDDGGSSDT
jgi:hypothetical protein